MALLTADFFSESLRVGTSMTVVLPQPTTEQVGVAGGGVASDFPLVYLLHGLSDDHTAWLRYTSVERYAEARGLAVVMPAVHRSFYADERHGHAYWTFISEELPAIVANFLRVSTDPARTFVAGLSMGGYGAMRLALTHPHRYAAAASLSGALDIAGLLAEGDRFELFHRVYGGQVSPQEDLLQLVGQATVIPPLWIGCGTEDELLAANDRFLAAARAAGFRVTQRYEPGEHEWGLWDAQLPEVFDFFLTTMADVGGSR